MKKNFQYITFCIIILYFFLIFKSSDILQKTVIESCYLWLTKVVPNLFIIFIMNDIIINMNLLSLISKYLNLYFNKLFNLTGNCAVAFILSFIGGTPAATIIFKDMLNRGELTIEDANKLMYFTFFINPLFLYNILKMSFDNITSIKIIITFYISNIFIGLIKKDKNKKVLINKQNVSSVPFYELIPNAITKSINILLSILGTIIFYSIIINVTVHNINISNNLSIPLTGFLEITQSLASFNKLIINSNIKEILALAIISFGGLSIHTQVLTVINNTRIKYKHFLIGRIYHVLISITTYLFINIFI